MLYADAAGIVSRSSEGLERMTTVIVTACSSFGPTVSEAETEIMCIQTNGGRKVSLTIISIQTNNRVCVLRRGYHRRQRP